MDLLSKTLNLLSEDPLKMIKMLLPVLLVISFIFMIIGFIIFYNLENKDTDFINTWVLTVPFIVFSMVVILTIILFVEHSASLFITITIIGTLVAGTGVVQNAINLSNKLFGQDIENIYKGVKGINLEQIGDSYLEKKDTLSK